MQLADIFQLHAPAYCEKFNALMLPSHRRAVRDISACRTPALGGHVYHCSPCDELRYSYHSCKNRHCPKCGNDSAQLWLQKQFDRMLPVPYFLVTFTLPGRLRALARSHQKIVYGILMDSAAAALQKLAAHPRWIGGAVGAVSVLQTWTRDLRYHPHVHMIVTGGGLSPDSSRWMPAGVKFLLPQAALSIIVAAKFRDALKRHGLFALAPAAVWRQRWVVDIRPVGSGHAAFRYLAPYIFRVALCNNRLVSQKNGLVTFRYQDSKTGNSVPLALPALDFMHQFLQHVLPLRFRKVRYYGLFSPQRKNLLAAARAILPPLPQQAHPSTPAPAAARPSVPLCTRCGKPMTLLQNLPRIYNTSGIRSP